MTQTYYALWYRLDQSDGYLIWFSDDVDGVITRPDGTIPSFDAQAQLNIYASDNQLGVAPMEPLLHDLDAVVSWLGHSLSANVDTTTCLTAWNLFTDCSASVNGDFDADHKRTKGIYNKLFWGNNLPAVTPPGEEYIPVWADDERLLLQEVLCDGLQLFQKYVTRR